MTQTDEASLHTESLWNGPKRLDEMCKGVGENGWQPSNK